MCINIAIIAVCKGYFQYFMKFYELIPLFNVHAMKGPGNGS